MKNRGRKTYSIDELLAKFIETSAPEWKGDQRITTENCRLPISNYQLQGQICFNIKLHRYNSNRGNKEDRQSGENSKNQKSQKIKNVGSPDTPSFLHEITDQEVEEGKSSAPVGEFPPGFEGFSIQKSENKDAEAKEETVAVSTPFFAPKKASSFDYNQSSPANKQEPKIVDFQNPADVINDAPTKPAQEGVEPQVATFSPKRIDNSGKSLFDPQPINEGEKLFNPQPFNSEEPKQEEVPEKRGFPERVSSQPVVRNPHFQNRKSKFDVYIPGASDDSTMSNSHNDKFSTYIPDSSEAKNEELSKPQNEQDVSQKSAPFAPYVPSFAQQEEKPQQFPHFIQQQEKMQAPYEVYQQFVQYMQQETAQRQVQMPSFIPQPDNFYQEQMPQQYNQQNMYMMQSQLYSPFAGQSFNPYQQVQPTQFIQTTAPENVYRPQAMSQQRIENHPTSFEFASVISPKPQQQKEEEKPSFKAESSAESNFLPKQKQGIVKITDMEQPIEVDSWTMTAPKKISSSFEELMKEEEKKSKASPTPLPKIEETPKKKAKGNDDGYQNSNRERKTRQGRKNKKEEGPKAIDLDLFMQDPMIPETIVRPKLEYNNGDQGIQVQSFAKPRSTPTSTPTEIKQFGFFSSSLETPAPKEPENTPSPDQFVYSNQRSRDYYPRRGRNSRRPR